MTFRSLQSHKVKGCKGEAADIALRRGAAGAVLMASTIIDGEYDFFQGGI